MQSIVGVPPRNRRRDEVEPLSQIKTTLGEHYRRKRAHYSFTWPANFDRDLRRLFSDERRFRSKPTAASFLRRAGRELMQTVAAGTGAHQYTLSQPLSHTIERCKLLRPRPTGSERNARPPAPAPLFVAEMNVVHTPHPQ